MPERINIAIYLMQAVAPEDRPSFLRDVADVLPDWLGTPARIMRLDTKSSAAATSVWPGALSLLTGNLDDKTILMIYFSAPDGQVSLSISETGPSAAYTIAVEAGAFAAGATVSLERSMVMLFRAASHRSSCVVACGSELEMEPNGRDIAAVAEAALSPFHNAYWMVLAPETYSMLEHVPEDVVADFASPECVLVRRTDSIRAHRRRTDDAKKQT